MDIKKENILIEISLNRIKNIPRIPIHIVINILTPKTWKQI